MKVDNSARSFLGMFIVLAVVGAWVDILFFPLRRPDLLPLLVGCYQAAGHHSAIQVEVLPSGLLVSNSKSTRFSIAEDKPGVAFLPVKRVIYDSDVGGGIQMISGNPLYLRISDDRKSFRVPGSEPELALYKKACR